MRAVVKKRNLMIVGCWVIAAMIGFFARPVLAGDGAQPAPAAAAVAAQPMQHGGGHHCGEHQRACSGHGRTVCCAEHDQCCQGDHGPYCARECGHH